MSALKEYVAEQQNIAIRIAGLIDAPLCLKDSVTESAEAEYVVAAIAHELSEQLASNLDTVNLPTEVAA